MSQEIMAQRGKLAVLKKKQSDLNFAVAGLVNIVRSYLDPFEEERSRLKVEEAHEGMNQLSEKVIELRKVENQIREIEDFLNG